MLVSPVTALLTLIISFILSVTRSLSHLIKATVCKAQPPRLLAPVHHVHYGLPLHNVRTPSVNLQHAIAPSTPTLEIE